MLVRIPSTSQPPKKLPNRIFLTIIIFISLMLLSLLGYFVYQNSEAYQKHQIVKHTQMLQKVVDGIDLSLKVDSKPSRIAVNSYNQNLDDVIKTCDQIKEKIDQGNQKKLSQQFKDNSKKALLLCKDLKAVAVYSRDVHTALFEYITYRYKSNNSEPNELIYLVFNSKNSFSSVKNNINDPAYDEINTQLTTAYKIAEEINTNQSSLPSENFSHLQKTISGQQIELWQRRVYYWNNTVMIDKLILAIKNQEKQWSSS